ncbi:MAG: hypothetical protein L0312_06250, partial [Acidobacteria bacterium]|nr:hypothetical protein [Acidobacteriota bacterium]
TATEKLLQIVLVGQPELSLKLNSPELRQLKQRISLRCTLDPLTLSETREYIRTRMEIAGVPNQQIFSDSTITEVFRCSGGIPRLVNTICDNALLNGYACDTRSIGVEIIHEVAEDLELSEAHRYPLRRARTAGERRTFGDLVAEGDYLEPRNNGKADSHESESFDLFVQFVDKLRDRSK